MDPSGIHNHCIPRRTPRIGLSTQTRLAPDGSLYQVDPAIEFTVDQLTSEVF